MAEHKITDPEIEIITFDAVSTTSHTPNNAEELKECIDKDKVNLLFINTINNDEIN